MDCSKYTVTDECSVKWPSIGTGRQFTKICNGVDNGFIVNGQD